MDNYRQAAKDAVARSWAVFPVLPNSKCPAVNRWEQRATRDPEVVKRYWLPGHGVGVACGPSRVVVIDLDVGDGRPPQDWMLPGVVDGLDVFTVLTERAGEVRWPPTFTVMTPSGGRHLYFQAPADREVRNSASKVGWKVDVRAAGGYVLGPGSVVDGEPYTVLDDTEPAPLPGWLADLADPPRPERPREAALLRPRRYDDAAYGEAALRGELDSMLAAYEGARNNTLFKSAANLGRLVAVGILSDTAVTDALAAAAREAGLSEWEATRTIASGLRAGVATPRGEVVPT